MTHLTLKEILTMPAEHCAGCPSVVECEHIRREYKRCREFIADRMVFTGDVPEFIREQAVEMSLMTSFGDIMAESARKN